MSIEFPWPEREAFGGAESRALRQARLLEQEFQLLQERNNDSLGTLKELEAQLGQIRAVVQAENRRVVGQLEMEFLKIFIYFL